MARDLAALGAKNVIVTGVSFEKDKLGVAVYDGKKVEYYFNEKFGVTTECGKFTSVDEIRNGTFKPLKRKPLSKKDKAKMDADQGEAPAETSGFASLDDQDGELPF
jgi:hypothetical protein